MSAEQVLAALLEAHDSSSAVHKIYLVKKDARKTSLEALCRAAGMPSKGYLSDVMHGKRVLNQSYRLPLARALGLKGLPAKYFKTLVDLDHERVEPRKQALRKELAGLRKAFDIVQTSQPRGMRSNSFAFEVFCAFGLFQGKPREADLLGYFGAPRALELKGALADLMASGYVAEAENGEGFALTAKQITFEGSEDGSAHLAFLNHAMQHAIEHLPRWAPQRDVAHFESVVISVKKEDYLKLLSRLRSDSMQWQAELENESADLLVRYNFQIYPL